MTPSELAKVREALDCASSEMRDLHPEHPAHVAVDQALAILDREAGRKTWTYFRLQRRGVKDINGGGWFTLRPCCETQAVADVEIAKFREFYDVDANDMRIIEVTESWEEPQS